MNYKIVADSGCDPNEELLNEEALELVPFNISVEGEEFLDDENIDLKDMMRKMIDSPNPVKTACPSPGDFLKSFGDGENIFVLTISSKLSGSYNSAVLARQMALEENPDRFIHVFDSKSASAGQTAVVLKIAECIEEGLENEEIVKRVEEYIKELKTFFILESLDNLIKNGRISKTKGLIASVLNITPIMGEDGEGEIIHKENARGEKRAFKRLVEIIGEESKNQEEKRLIISHNDALEKAEFLKERIEEKYRFKDVEIVATKGLSSSYAYDGGIVVAY